VPRAVLSAARLLAAAGTIDPEKVRALLATSKAEVDAWSGDEVTIDATPDRLDLLSEGGLGLDLAGALGQASGVPPMEPIPGAPPTIIQVSPSVARLRPSIAGVLVEAPGTSRLDEALLDEAVRFQELLHASAGGNRRWASFGIYPWDHGATEIRYGLEPLRDVRIVPLDGESELSGEAFFRDHPMALKFGELGRAGDDCLTLRDGAGNLLSLPPVLNARPGGEALAGNRRLLLESTGTRPARVHDGLGLLLSVFVARGWKLAPVRVEAEGAPSNGAAFVTPRELRLSAREFASATGFELLSPEVVRLLGRARLDARPVPDGWTVTVPPWRPDLLAGVDLVEEIVDARGVSASDAIVPPSPTLGRRRAETRFEEQVELYLLGLGYQPLQTTVMVPESTVALLGRSTAISIAYPVSELYARLRDTMLLSLVGSLAHNVRHPYPQRIAEVGPVIVRADAEESGAATRTKAGAVYAADGAGFADAAALVDYLMGRLGARGIREPATIPGTISGRAARVRLAGEVVAEVGELEPRVISRLGLPVPVAWAELDLSALWPLFRRNRSAPTPASNVR
jgi:phenylalanyl-tRNA synthetase beta chain